jgi:guanine deaminase
MQTKMNNTPKEAYRAALLRFDNHGEAILDSDGLLVIEAGKVIAVGSYANLQDRFAAVPTTHLSNRLIAPGFVDLHVHYPQIDIIGSCADGLLPWLTQHTFPEEARFSDPQHAAVVAEFFLAELLRHGVTSALTFSTSHPNSVNALFEAAIKTGQRIITGKCLQDRHCPEGVRDSTEQSLIDTEQLISRWHGANQGRLGYAITPRFAPSCSPAQLAGAAELAKRYPSTWIQSHVSENSDEIAWAKSLFPNQSSYLGIYDHFGLLRQRSVYAHCIHFDPSDRQLMRERGACAAVCPTSNQFLGSGNFDFVSAQAQGMAHGLASDVGGGTSLSPFKTMLAAYYAARSDCQSAGVNKTAQSLTPQRLWWLHTAGAAQALGLEHQSGNLAIGCDADFVVINPQATPLLARRTSQAKDLNDLLFAYIVLGDERCIEKTFVATP